MVDALTAVTSHTHGSHGIGSNFQAPRDHASPCSHFKASWLRLHSVSFLSEISRSLGTQHSVSWVMQQRTMMLPLLGIVLTIGSTFKKK